jgi:sRNA-binding carbon storage regulator CsrA
MLRLARLQGESLRIGNDIEVITDGVKITVKKINGRQAKLGINVPESMKVDMNILKWKANG